MKRITIDGKEYVFEFSIEASMYSECTENVMELFRTIGEAQSQEDARKLIKGISDISTVAVTMFYAGLMEHHGIEGDRTVLSLSDAKKLVKAYLNEHKEDGKGNTYSIMEEMMEVMADDGFFEVIGLAQMMRGEEKAPKTTQGRKKATGK